MGRVLILALGSRGDVEPCVALAKALCQDGHDVVIHALDDFRDLVSRAGIDFASMRASLPRPGRAFEAGRPRRRRALNLAPPARGLPRNKHLAGVFCHSVNSFC